MMDPEITRRRWERVQTLFAEALERDGDERSAFLRRACGDDVELYNEVDSLLNAGVHRLLDGRPVDAAQIRDAVQLLELSMLGERVGPYRVVRRLGAGGMGTVYLAERADGQFEQTVALKLVKRGMDTEAVVGRFQAERQILAHLEHPNIARLLDGGVHRDGRPYFALEYVSGEPITEFCDVRALPISERLRLFADVCSAVAYAHRNLVVHRDLKPSNILVASAGAAGADSSRADSSGSDSSGSARPTVKLLDFGIAKLLTGDDELMTRTGERALTPAYAAPEQISGQALTTATDVYGLGVVLYELLTGRRPFEANEREGPSLSREPERPSVAVQRHHEPNSPAEVARMRSTSPERLRRTLRGDLDTIVLMALRAEPERRYASAQDLLADIRACQRDEPVAAQPESATYRLRKYVRRHRVGVTATALVVLLGSLLVGFYTARLTAERDRAQLEAAKSEQVSAFLQGLFAVADPRESGGEDVTARELLDRGAERIDEDLADQPEVRAQMMHLIGEVYSTIGSYEQAERLLEETLRLRRSEMAPGEVDDPEVARTLVALGLLYERQGRYIEAAEIQREAVDILQRDASGRSLDLADAIHALSFLQMRLGNFDEAEGLIRQALDIKYASIGDDNGSVAYSLNILGDVLTFQKRFDEAEAVHLRTLDMRKRHLGADHLDVGFTLHNVGATMRDAGRYAAAEKYYLDALAVWRRHYGYDHQESANTLSQLGGVVSKQGRYDEADSLQDTALAMALGSVGPDHPKVAAIHIRRGDNYAAAGRLSKAEAAYRMGIETQRRVLGEGHPTVTQWQIRLGTVVAEQGRRQEAQALIRDSAARCGVPERGGYDGCAEAVAAALTTAGLDDM